MSSKNVIGNEISVDEQAFEQATEESDEDVLRPTVEQQTQAKVDANHPDGIVQERDERLHGVTLEQEERIRAEEGELNYYSERARTRHERGVDEATVSREASRRVGRAKRRAFEERAAAVEKYQDPAAPDPREQLSREQLAAVNEQAHRLHDEIVNAPSTAAISRQLAERVVTTESVMSAVLATKEALEEQAGVIQPITSIEPWMETSQGDIRVDIQGTVIQLFEPKSVSQQQVGVIQDETGTVKVTIWRRSNQGTVLHEGDEVRVTGGIAGWYGKQATVAVDNRTRLTVLERGAGPALIHGVRHQVDWADE